MINDEITRVLLALHNSGFHDAEINTTTRTIHMEDPTCIARTFESFVEIAWIAIVAIAGILTFVWAISLIRGVKNDLFVNMRNLAAIFILLAVLLPSVSKYLFNNICSEITADLDKVLEYMDERTRRLTKAGTEETYEILYVQDSGLQIPKEDLEGL